jgi:hypothetical protein
MLERQTRKVKERLRRCVERVAKYVNEDPECPHCQYFDTTWDGTVPSQFGNFVRPCVRHHEPRFPKITQKPAAAFSILENQLDKRNMVHLDWDAIEAQL